MSRFMDSVIATAARSPRGMVTGEPNRPVSRTWGQVHQQARSLARGMMEAGLLPGQAVAILAGQPAEVAPAAQAVWLAGGSVTMLHQPTPRTDLEVWLADTLRALHMIDARMVLVGEPFAPMLPVLAGHGIAHHMIAELHRNSGAAAIAETGLAGTDSAGTDFGETDSAATASAEIGPAKLGAAEIGAAGTGSTATGSTATGFAATDSLQTVFGEIGAVGAGFAETGFVEATEESVALLQLTSGSTADPRAVRITHGNLYANLTDTIAHLEYDENRDVMVSWLPLFHDMGMVGCLLSPMFSGIGQVSVAPTDFLSRPLLWAELLSKYGGTITSAPNFAWAILTRHLAAANPGSLDLSRLRVAANGAEPIDPATMDGFTAAAARFGFKPHAVNCCYGAAESTLVISLSELADPLVADVVDAVELERNRRAVPVDAAGSAGATRAARAADAAHAAHAAHATETAHATDAAHAARATDATGATDAAHATETARAADATDATDAAGAAHAARAAGAAGATDAAEGAVRRLPLLGAPLPGVEVRVVDDGGRALGDREVGRLQLRGPAVTDGYLTEQGFVPARDDDGWLDIGDEGYLCGGQIVVCGRRKDTIIMAGRNIYPTDIERAAAAVPGVRDGNVAAVRLLAGDGVARESFAVLVESRSAGDPLAVQAIREAVINRITAEIDVRPAVVTVLPPGTLPKTPSGKLRRSAARALVNPRANP